MSDVVRLNIKLVKKKNQNKKKSVYGLVRFLPATAIKIV